MTENRHAAHLTHWVIEDVAYDPALLAQEPWTKDIFAGWPSTSARKRVKLLVRRGVPVDSREGLWLTVTGANQHREGSSVLYSDTIKDLFGDEKRDDLQCPTAFQPSSGCIWWHLSAAGRTAACRVLLAVERVRPDVSVCPHLQPLVAMALHFVADEVQCFSLALALLQLRDKRQREFVNQTSLAVMVSRRNFPTVARRKAKRSYQWLLGGAAQRNGVSPPTVSFEMMVDELGSWDSWIFRELSFSTTVRVLDCFFVEGCKVYYRVAMAMMKTCYRHLAKSGELPGAEASVKTILDFCQKVAIADLLKCAFAIRNFSHGLLDKCAQKNHLLLSARALDTDSRPGTATGTRTVTLNVTSVECATIKDNELWSTIWQWLPARYQICQPRRIFSTEEDGYSLKTVYERCGDEEPLLLLVRTVDQEVFGAFMSTSLTNRLQGRKAFSYFGTGETFLFILQPTTACYRWAGLSEGSSGATDYFLAGDNTCWVVGGGDGYGLWLDASLDHGTSSSCSTFYNEPLTSQNGGNFRCAAVEVFAFADSY